MTVPPKTRKKTASPSAAVKKQVAEELSEVTKSHNARIAMQSLGARARATPRKRQTKEDFIKIFAMAEPPPGVLPKNVSASKLAMDEWGYSDAGMSSYLGNGLGNYGASSYIEGQQFLGYSVLAVLAQRAEYRVVTETLAADMTREWIRFESAKNAEEDKTDKIAELEDYLDQLQLKSAMKQSIEYDGFQGRGQIYLDFGTDIQEVGANQAEQEELRTSIGNGRDEVSKLKIKHMGLKKLIPIEPMWTYPYQYNASQPLRPDWYRPTTWFVMGTEVHRTRLVTFVGRPVPDLLKPAYSFGGLSMTQMIKPYVDLWLRDRTSASDLLNTFSTLVLLTTLDVTTMSQASGDVLWERIQTFNALRDNMGLLVLNKTTEDFKNVSASLGGISELVGQAQEHISSAAQIPTAKLLGIQPAGLNADSEGIIRLYYDRIKATQESLIRAPITNIVDIAQVALWGKVDNEINFVFNDLWQLDEAGKGGVQLTKAQIIETDIASGIITAEEGRRARAADKDSPYSSLNLDEGGAPGMQEEGGGEEEGLIDPQDAGKEAEREAGQQTRQAENFGGGESQGLAHDVVFVSFPEIGENAREKIKQIIENDRQEQILAMDKTQWNEELHPRDETGKFAKSGTASNKMTEMLKAAGFEKHPESEHDTELYHHPSGNSIGFKGPYAKTDNFAHYLNNEYQKSSYGSKSLEELMGQMNLKDISPEVKKEVEVKIEEEKAELPKPPIDAMGSQGAMYDLAMKGDLEGLEKKVKSVVNGSASHMYGLQLLDAMKKNSGELETTLEKAKKEFPEIDMNEYSFEKSDMLDYAKQGKGAALKDQIEKTVKMEAFAESKELQSDVAYGNSLLEAMGEKPVEIESKVEESKTESKEIPKPASNSEVQQKMHELAVAGNKTQLKAITNVILEPKYVSSFTKEDQEYAKSLLPFTEGGESTSKVEEKPAEAKKKFSKPLEGSSKQKLLHKLAEGGHSNQIKEQLAELSNEFLGNSSENYQYGEKLLKEMEGKVNASEAQEQNQKQEKINTKVKPEDLPKPNPDSGQQKEMHKVATQGKLDDLIQKVNKTKEDYGENSYSYKYGKELVEKMGGKLSTSAQTASAQTASAQTPPTKQGMYAPPADTKRYQRQKEAFAKAKQFQSTSSAGAEKAVPSLSKSFFNSIGTKATSAFKSYTGSGYSSMNSALRNWGSASPDVVAKINAMDDAFEEEAASITEDIIVRRGETVPEAYIQKWAETLKSGLPVKFTKDGFTSASLANKAAFGGNVMFEMCVKKGTKAIGVDTISGFNENEVLLRHGQNFELMEIEKKGGQYIVRMVSAS
jgi:uncharacterized protein